jgi:ATP-dependent DNA helicase RecG
MSVLRNRRIADAFQKCGLVERGGQGMDLIFRAAITEGKPLPDFTGSDDYQVALTLRGDIQDEQFLRFLERIGKETLESFSIEDLLLLDKVHREERIPGEMKPRTRALVEQGILESYGRGRGVHFILSRKFYGFLEQKGAYTRKRGLDRSTNKELLFKHIVDNQKEGSPMKDLLQVLPNLTRDQVKDLLRDLKKERRVYPEGKRKMARWYPC